jgi:aspartate 1-decarboxylase
MTGRRVHIKATSNCNRLLIYRVGGESERQAIKFNSADDLRSELHDLLVRNNFIVFISIK